MIIPQKLNKIGSVTKNRWAEFELPFTQTDPTTDLPAGRRSRSYSHFFHLKIQYGTIAAISIITSAIG
ncbi:hypothetical protein ACVJGD_003050 [Bradyrhizobium sp. USDA 10063]